MLHEVTFEPLLFETFDGSQSAPRMPITGLHKLLLRHHVSPCTAATKYKGAAGRRKISCGGHTTCQRAFPWVSRKPFCLNTAE